MDEKQKQNEPEMAGPKATEFITESVEVTIDMLRQQIMGMKTKLTRNSSTSNFGESLTAMSQKMENNKEECEKRVQEAKKRHRRETEKRVQEYESAIHYLQDQLAEEERRSSELRGRLEECRTAKNQAMTELAENREDYDKQVKELQDCVSHGRKELALLQNEREKYHLASSKLKILEESMEKSEVELEELRQATEDLRAELEQKNKMVDQLESVKRELEDCKDRVEKECNEVKEKMEEYVELLKEHSNQDSLRKVLEDQVEKMQKECDELKVQVDGEKTRAADLQTEVTGLQQQNQEMESLYIQKTTDLNCEIEKIHEKNEELMKKIEEIERNDENLREAETAFKAKVEDLENQIHSKNEQLEDAGSTQDELKAQINELEKERNDLKQQLTDMEAALESSKLEITRKTLAFDEQIEKIEAKDQEIKVLKENVKTLKDTTSILDEQLVAFEAVLEEKMQEIEETKRMQNLVDQENKDVREQLRKCRIELNEAKSINVYTEQTMKSAQNSLKNIAESKESEVLAVMQKLEVTEKRNEELLDETMQLTSQLTQLEAEKFELRKELETSNADRDRYTRDLHVLLKNVVDAKEVNYKLSSELEKAAEDARACRDELEEQDAKLVELETSLSRKEVMYSTVTQQQNKLIQHLTDELEKYQEKDDKKKRRH